MTFNFHHLKVDYPQGDKWTLAAPDFVQLKAIFAEWQRGMHDVAWNALFWCNHDQPRIVTRFGDEGARNSIDDVISSSFRVLIYFEISEIRFATVVNIHIYCSDNNVMYHLDANIQWRAPLKQIQL